MTNSMPFQSHENQKEMFSRVLLPFANACDAESEYKHDDKKEMVEIQSWMWFANRNVPRTRPINSAEINMQSSLSRNDTFRCRHSQKQLHRLTEADEDTRWTLEVPRCDRTKTIYLSYFIFDFDSIRAHILWHFYVSFSCRCKRVNRFRQLCVLRHMLDALLNSCGLKYRRIFARAFVMCASSSNWLTE